MCYFHMIFFLKIFDSSIGYSLIKNYMVSRNKKIAGHIVVINHQMAVDGAEQKMTSTQKTFDVDAVE